MFIIKFKKERMAKLKNVIFSLVGIGFGLALVVFGVYFAKAQIIVNVAGTAQVSNTATA